MSTLGNWKMTFSKKPYNSVNFDPILKNQNFNESLYKEQGMAHIRPQSNNHVKIADFFRAEVLFDFERL